MDKIAFPYRSPTHLPLLHVIAEAGSWEKYGLEVDYDRKIGSSEAHEAVAAGEVEFVGGNHVSTYGRRARGDGWIYLGQTVNVVPGRQLIVRPESGIRGLADLRRKRVGISGHHPALNDWLFLKQHGLDVDRDEVELIDRAALKATGDDRRLWELVRDGKVDAVFAWPPATVFAARAGLTLIDVEPMPMIFFTTLSSSAKFVAKHPEVVERFLKGTIEGIRFFKTQPERAIRVIRERYDHEGVLDDEAATVLYRSIADALEPRLYPTPEAIANVYEEGVRHDRDAAKINPLELWDLHFIRRLDDEGFVDALYGART